MRFVIALLASGGLLCTPAFSKTKEQKAAEKALIASAAARPVTCVKGDDCEVKWSRALRFVTENVAYRISQQSDTMIATLGPLPNDPRPAVSITKLARGDGMYDLDLRAGCDNIFGCSPSLVQLQAGFVLAVMGAPYARGEVPAATP